MPNYSNVTEDDLQYQGLLTSAAQVGLTSQEVWTAIGFYAEENDLPTPSFLGVTALYSYGVQIRNASGNLAQATAIAEQTGLPQALDASMIVQTPQSRSLEQQAASPLYAVRYPVQVGEEGEEEVTWGTMSLGPTIPATTDSLYADLQSEIEGNEISSEWESPVLLAGAYLYIP